MKTRKIAFFTGTRADYGILSPLIHAVEAHPHMTASVLATGTHLSHRHGYTLDAITGAGHTVEAVVETLSATDTPLDVCNAMAAGMRGYAQALSDMKPDMLIILGDRYEALAAAACATVLRIPVAHLHGGEITQGAMDDAFRHAITKMSHLHFTATDSYRNRVIQLGEHPDRVFHVGSLAVEALHAMQLLDDAAIRDELDLPRDMPFIVATFHPVTLDPTPPEQQIKGLLDALAHFEDYAVIFTGTNADPGGDSISQAICTFTDMKPHTRRMFASLGQLRYFSAVRAASLVIGNSSSGIIEVPSLRTPVIDIGTRQLGRVRSDSVVHCRCDEKSIVQKMRIALSPDPARIILQAPNPYDKAGTCASIVSILARSDTDEFFAKGFYDLPQGGRHA